MPEGLWPRRRLGFWSAVRGARRRLVLLLPAAAAGHPRDRMVIIASVSSGKWANRVAVKW